MRLEPGRVLERLRIGISGWTYAPWRGVFFPKGLPQKRELAFASRQVNSIEINGSFYSLQRPASYRAWYGATPPGFVFAVKAGRYLTHLRRLKDVETPLANFFASGVLCLREKLGPFLWQLPPNFRFDRDRLATFFDLLPGDTAAAAKLAQRHDDRLAGRTATEPEHAGPLRHALEIRHPSFETGDFVELLREHNIGLVIADTAGKWPFIEDVTSDFVYVRLHGSEQLYVSGYTDAALDEWARKIRTWVRGGTPEGAKRLGAPNSANAAARDIYVYFDNDAKVHAPFDAIALAKRLGFNSPPDAVSDPFVPPS